MGTAFFYLKFSKPSSVPLIRPFGAPSPRGRLLEKYGVDLEAVHSVCLYLPAEIAVDPRHAQIEQLPLHRRVVHRVDIQRGVEAEEAGDGGIQLLDEIGAHHQAGQGVGVCKVQNTVHILLLLPGHLVEGQEDMGVAQGGHGVVVLQVVDLEPEAVQLVGVVPGDEGGASRLRSFRSVTIAAPGCSVSQGMRLSSVMEVKP